VGFHLGSLVRNFGEVVAKRPCSERWVSRFLQRHNVDLTAKYTTGIDRSCFNADLYDKYKLYFNLLYKKIWKHNVEARHIYNMDEKDFLIGITSWLKRVFSKQLWERKEVTAGLQDGSREWITILACICVDGTAVKPSIIYAGKRDL
jgi:hypothetical protein